MTLEELFKRSLSKDSYNKGSCDLSTTQILSPPQTSWLKSQHDLEPESIYKAFMSTIGTGVHAVLEAAANEKELVEHRFYHTWDLGINNPLRASTEWTLGGMLDFAFDGRVEDYKVTSVANYEITDGGLKEEHRLQCQINAWLANHDDEDLLPGGRNIQTGAVLYIFRDWSYSLAKQGRHPETPYMYHEFDIMPEEEIEQEIILPRMRDHANALNGRPRPCTEEERWQRKDMWAVQKFGATRAYRNFEKEHEAIECRDKMKKPQDYVIEFRAGECIRCSSWCLGSVCPQYQEILGRE